jgi:hypothetical protein
MYNFYILIALGIIFVSIGVTVFVIVLGMKKRGRLERALNMTLLLVKVPREYEKDSSIQRAREAIGIAEQLLSSFGNLHSKGWNQFIYGEPYISLELAVQNTKEETSFYISVPRTNADSIERQIYGYYPNAEILKVKDYNIFHLQGAAAGASLQYEKNAILPIKTYQKLETDPEGALLTALSKLKAQGEGAALQILLRPAHADDKKKYANKVAREMQMGYTFGDAMKHIDSPPKEDKENPTPPPSRMMTPTEEEIIKQISGKASKTLFDVNIRMIASADHQARADQIVDEMQSSLTQFTSPDLNSFKINRLQDKALDNLLYNFAFRIFDEKESIILSTEEVGSLYHLPVAATTAPRVNFLKTKPSEPPTNLPAEGLIIAKSLYRGEEKDIRLTKEDRRRHLYVIGQTGSGKTTLMKQMMKQDIEKGEGICVLDPAGDFAEFCLSLVPKSRAEDVIYVDPADLARPIGLNMFEINPDNPEEKTKVINEMFQILDRLYNLKETGGPVFEKYFRNASLLLLDDYRHEIPTLADISRVLTDDKFRKDKLSRETNPLVTQFWTQEAEKAGGEAALANIAPYISTKLDVFISNEFLRPILNQPVSTINFQEAMDQGKILICNLSKGKIGELNARLLGSLIVGKLAIAAFSREGRIPENERRDFYLYMDEFQNFTTESVKTILSEARKYRLCLTLAHQYIKQLPDDIRDAVFGNVGSMIALRVSPEDAEMMKIKFEPIFSPGDLSSADNLNGYASIIIGGQTTRPFNIKIDFTERGPQEMIETLKELSRLKYGRPREEIEEELRQRYRTSLANAGL